jgi:hypothetical protein
LHTGLRVRESTTYESDPEDHFTKLWQETQSPKIDLLLLPLIRKHRTPKPSAYSPFEILYGRPPPIINRLRRDLRQIGNLDKPNISRP